MTGYNANCYYQTCTQNCCNYSGYCPSSSSGCYYYYSTTTYTCNYCGYYYTSYSTCPSNPCATSTTYTCNNCGSYYTSSSTCPSNPCATSTTYSCNNCGYTYTSSSTCPSNPCATGSYSCNNCGYYYTSTTSCPTNPCISSYSTGVPIGAIIGGSVGAIALILILIFSCIAYKRYQQRKLQEEIIRRNSANNQPSTLVIHPGTGEPMPPNDTIILTPGKQEYGQPYNFQNPQYQGQPQNNPNYAQYYGQQYQYGQPVFGQPVQQGPVQIQNIQ